MEIRLIKDWKRGGKVRKKGMNLFVTNELGKSLIKKKIARKIKEAIFPFLAKKVVPDGTKQTAKKVKTKKVKENGNDREI